MTTDLVKVDNAVVAALVDGTEMPEVIEAGDVALQITQQILGAEDVDAILAMFEGTPAQDVLDVPLEVVAVKFNRSSFVDGPPVYALIDATRGDTGERITISCGGRSVMAALYRMWQLDAFPQKLKIKRSKRANEAGNHYLLLARA